MSKNTKAGIKNKVDKKEYCFWCSQPSRNDVLDEAIEAVDKNMSQSPELMQAIEILEQLKGNK